MVSEVLTLSDRGTILLDWYVNPLVKPEINEESKNENESGIDA